MALFMVITEPFLQPTIKQMDACCRWLHTLSAACMVGAVSIAFTKLPSGAEGSAANVVALSVWGVVLFIGGAILGKGE